MPTKKSKSVCYVVIRGRKPGIYFSYEECKQQVQNFSNSRFNKCYSMSEAKALLEMGLAGTTCEDDSFIPFDEIPEGIGKCYVVLRGHVPGIYLKWETVLKQIKGYVNCFQRKCKNIGEVKKLLMERRIIFKIIPVKQSDNVKRLVVRTRKKLDHNGNMMNREFADLLRAEMEEIVKILETTDRSVQLEIQTELMSAIDAFTVKLRMVKERKCIDENEDLLFTADPLLNGRHIIFTHVGVE